MRRKLLVFAISMITLSALLCGTALADTYFLGHKVTYNLTIGENATAYLYYAGVPCYTFSDAKYWYSVDGHFYYKYDSNSNMNGGPTIASTANVPYGCVHELVESNYNVEHDSQGWSDDIDIDLR